MDYSNYNRNKEEVWCSWPIILLSLYLFFPLGIYLIVKKQTLHRRNIFTIGQKTLSSAISLFICGVILYLPKILLLFSNLFEEDNVKDLEIIVNSIFYTRVMKYGTLFIFLGFVVFLIGLYQKKKGKRYRSYINLVINKEFERIDDISSKMSLNKEIVLRDLNSMIEKGYLENYEIDYEENRIYSILREKQKKEEKLQNTRIVTCPNCHAQNKLEEKIGKCEFCNSYIE